MNIKEYLRNPCKASSLPYWKTVSFAVPNGICIVHDDYFHEDKYKGYVDERYFKLFHDLKNIKSSKLPYGYKLTELTASSIEAFAQHINGCYDEISVSYEDVKAFTKRAVFDEDLWVSVINEETQQIVATGIAEFDEDTKEGVLEWIQVSEIHRGLGLGQFIVNELLNRLKYKANFVTVCGKSDALKPEKLYRKCGFNGDDIWHILRRIDKL